MKQPSGLLARSVDIVLTPIAILAAVSLKGIRRLGVHRLPLCRQVLLGIGVLPVRRHYYEPFVHPDDLRKPLEQPRNLPGIDWNIEGQRQFLKEFRYAAEIADLTEPASSRTDFRLNNGSFESGDAEYLYQLIRAKKPRRIIEIGSGHSTLIAQRAIRRNREEIGRYECDHVCIEPFEAPWLEQAGATVIRERVEAVPADLFAQLGRDDLLFIDSSHVIRPQGDVVTEYLEILPSLKPGVLVHVHDVFSPRDYLREWMVDRMWLWNEQYLLEAFLTNNDSWQVVGALNLLRHAHFEELQSVCPYLTRDREPGSFYIQRIK
jgi:predicted O-methyltransferase YrrM